MATVIFNGRIRRFLLLLLLLLMLFLLPNNSIQST